MKWDDSEQDARWIKDTTGWMDITDLEEMGVGPGVFVFANAGYIVKFVGMNEKEDVRAKRCISLALAEGRAGESKNVIFLYTNTADSARIFRDFLVRKYDPPYNQGNVPEFKENNNNKIG